MNLNYKDNLKQRREFFQKNFPMIKIGKQRVDKSSLELLKNTCPVCGYMTLEERDAFEICGICFWEDDGIDDFEANIESGPNHMTLNEGRKKFEDAKLRILTDWETENILILNLSMNFKKLDELISQNESNVKEIVKLQGQIISLLFKNRIFGIGNLFDE